MFVLFLFVTTAIAFCTVGGALLWRGSQRTKPQSARRSGTALASALRFATAAFSRRVASRTADAAFQIRWGDQGSPDIELSRVGLQKHGLCDVPLRLGAKEPIADFILSVAQVFGPDAGSPTLKIVFSSALTSQLRNGQLDLIRRTIGTKPLAFDPKSGKIREIPGIAAAVNASAAVSIAWEVDAYVTAKKFSQDIGQCLRFIAGHMQEIRLSLFEQQESEMNADYHYLLQVSLSAEMGNLSPEDATVAGNQLDTVEERIGDIFSAVEKRLEQRAADLKQSHDPEMWRPEDLAGAVRFEISYFAELSWLALLALQMRAAATYLRLALPLSKDSAPGQLRDLSADHTRFQGVQRWFLEKIGDSVANIDQCARQQQTDDSAALRVRAYRKETEDQLSAASSEVESVIARLQSAVDAETDSKPVEVFAKIDGANVTLAVSGRA